jgi:hypothetical protein
MKKSAKAEIFLHTNFETGEIVQVDVFSWWGDIWLYELLTDEFSNSLQDNVELFEKAPIESALFVEFVFDEDSDSDMEPNQWWIEKAKILDSNDLIEFRKQLEEKEV